MGASLSRFNLNDPNVPVTLCARPLIGIMHVISRAAQLAAKRRSSGKGVNHCFHAYLIPPAVDSGPQAWTCSASATVLATRATAWYVDSSGLS